MLSKSEMNINAQITEVSTHHNSNINIQTPHTSTFRLVIKCHFPDYKQATKVAAVHYFRIKNIHAKSLT